MKQVISDDDIKQLGTILSIWAHPDDESFMCAGIMSTAVANGQTVACITATRGELGIQDESRWPGSKLSDIRTLEMESALEIMGINNHHWLGYGDGCCAEADESDAVDIICEFINAYEPNTILTFGPDGLTGHPDHQTVSRWANLAAQKSNQNVNVYQCVQVRESYEFMKKADDEFDIFFNIDNPPLKDEASCDIYFRLSDNCSDMKFNALKAMTSQTEAMINRLGKEHICKMTSIEAFMCVTK